MILFKDLPILRIIILFISVLFDTNKCRLKILVLDNNKLMILIAKTYKKVTFKLPMIPFSDASEFISTYSWDQKSLGKHILNKRNAIQYQHGFFIQNMFAQRL